jgi:farnesyl-diphosphate farnesyltransferase
MATELVNLHYQLPEPVAEQLNHYSQFCGRGLQKTNIIKDFRDDVTRGISYLPEEWLSEVDYSPLFLKGAPSEWNRKVLFDVLAELKEATRYTIALPFDAFGYRVSSLLCLLPALQTLLFAARNQAWLFTPQHPKKIDHQTFAQCIQDTQRLTHNNEEILAYYQEIEDQMNAAFIEN